MRMGAVHRGLWCAAAASLAALPLPAIADAATHILSIKATTTPPTRWDGAGCRLQGTLRAVRDGAAQIDVIFEVGGSGRFDYTDAGLSFRGVGQGRDATAEVEVGGGDCARQTIRRIRVKCPDDGGTLTASGCRLFTNVQIPALSAPRLWPNKVMDGAQANVAQPGVPGGGVGDAGCASADAIRAAAAARAGQPGVAPVGLVAAALDSRAAHGCASFAGSTIGIVDFALPSGRPRMWLIDLATGAGLDRPIHVAHGRGSDSDHDGLATVFGDTNRSNMSSLGAYRIVARVKSPSHGRALSMAGLDPSNAHAFERKILVHTTERGGLDYVSPAFLRSAGKLGRSLGCLVVMRDDFERVATGLAGGGFLYAGRSDAL